MSTKYPTPSRRYRTEHGPYISWFLNGQWVKFKILGPEDSASYLPEEANLIGHALSDDHLETLYQDGEQFYRHAGGGRGFYWTQELQVAEEMSDKAYHDIKAQHVKDTFT